MIETLQALLRPYKYELLIVALFVVVPIVFLASIKFRKFQCLILGYCIWMMHRFESFETVSFFYISGFKGSQYSMSIHHVDLLMPAIFFACLINKDLKGKLQIPRVGLTLFLIFFFSQFFTGHGADDRLWIRSWFSIFAHLRMLLFFVILGELLKVDHLRKTFFNVIIFLVIFTGVNCIKDRYLYGVQMPVGGYFMTYNQQGYIICSMSGIFFGLLLNQAHIKISRNLLYGLMSMAGATAILSQNRGAQMNLFATVFGVLSFDLLLKLNVGKIKIIFVLFIFALAGMIKSSDTLYERYFGTSKNNAGTRTRKNFYVRGYESFRQHKFTGLGTNLYTARVYDSDAAREAVLENTFFDRESPSSPHQMLAKENLIYERNRAKYDDTGKFTNTGVIESYWLLCLVEYGLVGFIPLAILWLYFYYQTFRNAFYFRKRNIYYYALSTGLFGTMTGCIVHNMTEWCARQSQAMYFVAAYFALISLCSYVRKKGTYSEKIDQTGFFGGIVKKANESVVAEPI